MPALKSQQRIALRRTMSRVVGGAAVLLSAAFWYFDSPIRTGPAPQPQAVQVALQPSIQQERQLTDLSTARQVLPMLERSILRLEGLKHLSPEQARQLDSLQARRRALHQLEDHELRLSLHREDSSFDQAAAQRRINQLNERLGLTPAAID